MSGVGIGQGLTINQDALDRLIREANANKWDEVALGNEFKQAPPSPYSTVASCVANGVSTRDMMGNVRPELRAGVNKINTVKWASPQKIKKEKDK